MRPADGGPVAIIAAGGVWTAITRLAQRPAPAQRDFVPGRIVGRSHG